VNLTTDKNQSCLWTAAFNGHTDLLHELVSARAGVNLQCSDGFSSLSVVCQNGHFDVVKLLLECGAEVETHDHIGRCNATVFVCQ